MINRDYLIIGAGLAGVCACEGIREHDKKGSILLVGRELYPPYHRPPLSKKFLKNGHMGVEELMHTPEQWLHATIWKCGLGTVVREFNIERRLAVLQDGQVVEFRKALLATGSRPRRPQVAGAHPGQRVLSQFRTGRPGDPRGGGHREKYRGDRGRADRAGGLGGADARRSTR